MRCQLASTHEVPLSYDQVIGALQALVYAPELASLIPPLIARAEAGDYAPLFAAAMMFTDDLSRTMNFALYYAVTCAEDAPRVAPAEAEQALATLRASALAEHSLAACGGWPRPPMPADFYAPVVSDTPDDTGAALPGATMLPPMGSGRPRRPGAAPCSRSAW